VQVVAGLRPLSHPSLPEVLVFGTFQPEKMSEDLESRMAYQAGSQDSAQEMMTRYKFCKFKEGRGSYAVIGLTARPSEEFRISYSEHFPKWALHYDAAIQDGIRSAFDAYASKEGGCMEFEVAEFEDFPVDTKACDVTCAAGAAAWLELGGSESDLVFERDGKWQIRFP